MSRKQVMAFILSLVLSILCGAYAYAGVGPTQILAIDDQGSILGGVSADLGVSMTKSELASCSVSLNLYEVERKGGQVAIVGDGQIGLKEGLVSFEGAGVLDSVNVDGVEVLIGYLYGRLDSGTRVNLGIHWIPERSQHFVTAVIGTLGNEPPTRIHIGALVREMSDAVSLVMAEAALDSEEKEISAYVGIFAEDRPVEYMGSSTGRAYYSGTYYDVVTVAGWSNSDTHYGDCLTSARVWSHSTEVVDYFNDAHPTTWGDDAVAESALVSEAVTIIDFGTPYDWMMDPRDPESDASDITVSFSIPIDYWGLTSLSISFPISGVDVTTTDKNGDFYREEVSWEYWGYQSNSETDLDDDPAVDENGNGGLAMATWESSGSATTQSYTVGYLTYAVNLVVNNDDVQDYHCVEYYSTPTPDVEWYVEAGD